MGQFLDSLNGQTDIEYLLPYAPELNPVEHLSGHWKQLIGVR
jgi:transposase